MAFAYAVFIMLLQAFIVWKVIKACRKVKAGMSDAREKALRQNTELIEKIREEERQKLVAAGKIKS